MTGVAAAGIAGIAGVAVAVAVGVGAAMAAAAAAGGRGGGVVVVVAVVVIVVVGDLDSDEAKTHRRRTKEPVQAKNKTGTTPSNQTRRQAGGLYYSPLYTYPNIFHYSMSI